MTSTPLCSPSFCHNLISLGKDSSSEIVKTEFNILWKELLCNECISFYTDGFKINNTSAVNTSERVFIPDFNLNLMHRLLS